MSRGALPWITARRAALAVYIGCFAVGVISHSIDFAREGWWPYRFGPLAMNLFWNLLILLDAAVIALLVGPWRTSGLALAVLVMLADVACNAYALFGLGLRAFTLPLLLQSIFLGFVLGSVALLQPNPSPELT